MKTTTLPPVRIEPELRKAVESVLNDGESFSAFTETSVRELVNRRQLQRQFLARGLAAREEAKQTGIYFDAREVHDELRAKLEEAIARKG